MRIDLTDAYRRVGEMLDAAGHAGTAYSLSISWWNHRAGDVTRAFAVEVYVAWKTTGSVYSRQTIEEAIRLFAEDLHNHPAPPPPPPHSLPEVAVDVPF